MSGIRAAIILDKIDFLVKCCRLRYSEINGVVCTDPEPCGLEKCSDPVIAGMTGHEYLTLTERSEIDFTELRLTTHPELFTVPDFRQTFEVLKNAIHSYHNFNQLNKEAVNKNLLKAIDIGNNYLMKSGAAINQKINFDYVVKQPVI